MSQKDGVYSYDTPRDGAELCEHLSELAHDIDYEEKERATQGMDILRHFWKDVSPTKEGYVLSMETEDGRYRATVHDLESRCQYLGELYRDGRAAYANRGEFLGEVLAELADKLSSILSENRTFLHLPREHRKTGLADTPYRVFYLIENGLCNRSDGEFHWNLRVERDDRGHQTNYHTVIRAFQEDDFNRVWVGAYDVVRGLYDGHVEVSNYREMPWYDMDEDVVSIVKAYYGRNGHGGDFQRQVRFADMVQNLLENSDSVRVTVSELGCPMVSVNGLPHLYTGGGRGSVDLKVEMGFTGGDYLIDIRDGDRRFTTDFNGLWNMKRQSDMYDELYDYLRDFLGFGYYDE